MRPLIFLLLFSATLSSCSLAIKRSQKLYNEVNKSNKIYDAIIVPGVPLQHGRWDSTMKARVLWSVYLYRNKITKNIIFSGAAVYTPFYEAIAMGLYAKALGVPASHIFYDTLAKHSTENIYYSYKLAQRQHFRSIALATDPFQSALLNSFTRKRFRSPIQHIPIQFDIIKNMNGTHLEIDSMLAYKENFQSIMQTESFINRLRGTLGRQIYFGSDRKLRPLE